MKKVHRIGFLSSGGKLTIENGFIKFQSPYGRRFRVAMDQIETVTVDDAGLGKSLLKVIGNGTDLASTKLPSPWAYKAQEWILDELKQK